MLEQMIRIGIIGDSHGRIPNVKFKNVDFMLCPGDFCGDDVRNYMFQAQKANLERKDKDKKIYWWNVIGEEKAQKAVLESVAKGRAVLEHLNSFGIPVYVLPGNWDWIADKEKTKYWSFLKTDFYKQNIKGLKNIVDCDMKLKDVGDYLMVGYGKVSGPEYPQDEDLIAKKTQDELKKAKKEYEKIKKKVNNLFERAEKINKPVIFFHHNVPYGTKLDQIVNPQSPMNGRHFGSVIVKEMIEKYQPLLSEAGHMHEHYDKDLIGRTVCINSGFGQNANVLVVLKGNKVESVEFNKI
ncbi:MAG: metallophosphoesterase [Nanoarchaeota archaeon]